jgi:hypothetical protein
MLVSKIHGPDASTSTEIENPSNLGIRLVGWSKSQLSIKSEVEDVVLEIWEAHVSQYQTIMEAHKPSLSFSASSLGK